MKRTALALALALPALLLAAPALADKEVRQTVPLDADGTLTIKTYKGSVSVETGTAAEVKIDARIEPDGDDRDQPRKVEQTRVEIRGSGRSVTVRSDYDDVKSRHHIFPWNNDGTLPFVRYRITMPKTARLVIDDYKSEIDVAPLSSELTLETYKGTATIRGLEGRARLTTYKGDVRVDVPRLAGDLRCETYKGTFDVTLPRDARFTLDAQAGRRGSFETDFSGAVTSARRGRRDEDDVRGDVNGGGPRVEMETYKGTLTLRAK
jgi:hypothetical protein